MRKIIGFVISICMVVALVGCGSESGYIDTSSESNAYESASMTENSETSSLQDSQTPSETETQKPSESETQNPSESETQEPSETETQEPSETETQKPSETETQEPSESETQKPSESETQEPSESETEEPSEQYEEYVLSTQNYDFARQVSEKYYVVSDDGECYGLVDFNGNEVVPIKYEEYHLTAENEIEFRDDEYYYDKETGDEGTRAYVYSLKTGKLVYTYLGFENVGVTEDPYEIIEIDGIEHEFRIGYLPEWVGYADASLYRSHQNGLIMERYEVAESWGFNYDTYAHDGYCYREVITFKNASTGTIIYSGYTDSYDGCVVAEFSADPSESKAIMLEHSIKDNKYYLVVVDLNGYQKCEIEDKSIFVRDVKFSSDWIQMPGTATLINTKTMEIIAMSMEKESISNYCKGWGEYYALETNDETYTIYKSNKVIATGYIGVDFIGDYIICRKTSGQRVLVDYNGKEYFTVEACAVCPNDRYLIYDGIGVYYIDERLSQVSDYVYKGAEEIRLRSGAIMVDGKYYLIAKK